MHKHTKINGCKHKLEYCEDCDAVYCEKCLGEWTKPITQQPQIIPIYPDTNPYNPWPQPTTPYYGDPITIGDNPSMPSWTVCELHIKK